MSNRIAVFNDGRIEQVGTPTEVYERPTPIPSSPASSASPTCSSRRDAASPSGRRR